MKLLILSLSLLMSVNALARSPYSLESVPHEDIDSYMTIGSDETNTPKNLQGLWWMDGNPLPDEVVSFASAQIEAIEEDGEIVGWEAYIPVYDEGIWTWHDSLAGRALYRAVEKNNLVYRGIFNADWTFGQVTPNVRLFSVLPNLNIPQSRLLDFSMTQVTENEWRRDSVLFGGESSYRFRQIVDGEGNRLPAYDEYVQSIKDRNIGDALMPVCTKDDGEFLPTSCARL